MVDLLWISALMNASENISDILVPLAPIIIICLKSVDTSFHLQFPLHSAY